MMSKRRLSDASPSEANTAEEDSIDGSGENNNGQKRKRQNTGCNPEETSSLGSPFHERGLHCPLMTQKSTTKSRRNDMIDQMFKAIEDEMEWDPIEALMTPKRCPSSVTLQSPESSVPWPPSNNSAAKMSSTGTNNNQLGYPWSNESQGLSCLQWIQFEGITPDVQQQVNGSLRKFLQRNFVKLKQELDPDGVADRLCEFDVITDTDREKIREAGFHLYKCDILLKTLVRYSKKIQENDKSLVRKIKDSLEKEKCGYLFEGFKVENVNEKQNETKAPLQSCSDDWKEKLSVFEKVEGDEVDPKNIIDKLLEKEVIGFDEHENIQDIPFKPHKLKYLIKYIQKKTIVEYEKFVEVIKEEYPALSNSFKKDEAMQLSAEPKITITHMRATASSTNDLANQAELKLSLCGNGEEIEQMVVDDNSNGANERVMEEMMDFAGFEIKKWEYSSIRMVLKGLSKRSQMLLLEQLKSSPDMLEKVIQHTFNSKHYEKLGAKKISLIDFKVKIQWPDFEISREDIAQNYCLLKEKIEPKLFVDLLKSANAATELIELIETSESRPVRCKEFLMYLVNDEDSPIDCFYAALQKLEMTEVISFLMEPSRQTTKRMCSCKLTKSFIVNGYSRLVQEMTNVEDILRAFEQFPAFDDSNKTWFHNLLRRKEQANESSQNQLDKEDDTGPDSKLNKAAESKADTFLRKILEMSDDGNAVCLLEQELHRTNQEKLLQEILDISSPVKDCLLTVEDIKRNRTFLQNELEPRRFLDMLRGIDGMDDVKEKILSTSARQTRCKEFLNALERNKIALVKFGSELKRLQLTKITKFLIESRQQGSGENILNKADIKRSSGFLQEEIEPRKFLNMLRGIKNTEDVIEKILSSSPRRMRCSRFYDFLLNADGSVLQKFQEELDKLQMSSVTSFLINSRPGRYQDTTSVKEALIDSYKCIIDEIEPRCLQNFFVERHVYTDEEFSRICDSTSRRGRAVCLMQNIMKGPVSKAYCLINALEAGGYVSLVKSIRSELATYKKCPRLYKILSLGKEDQFIIEGQFKIDNIQAQKQGEHTTTHEETMLPSQTVDTSEYVTKWIEDHIGKADHAEALCIIDEQTQSAWNDTADAEEKEAVSSVPLNDNRHLRRKSDASDDLPVRHNVICTNSKSTNCMLMDQRALIPHLCHNESSSLDSHNFHRQEETVDQFSNTTCSPRSCVSKLHAKVLACSSFSDETLLYSDDSQNSAMSKNKKNG